MTIVQGWDETTKHADSAGRFLRLKAGDKVVVAFCGEPCAIDRVFIDDKTYETYDPKVHGTAKRSPRFFMNVFDVAQRVMKIMDGGKAWFDPIVAAKKKYGFDTSLFEIARVGEGKQTKYTVMLEEKVMPADLAAAIQSAELHDLAQAIADNDDGEDPQAAKARAGSPNKPSSGAATIDAATAETMIQRLNLLGSEAKERFKQTFGVIRLRDLPAAKVDAVWKWIDAQADL